MKQKQIKSKKIIFSDQPQNLQSETIFWDNNDIKVADYRWYSLSELELDKWYPVRTAEHQDAVLTGEINIYERSYNGSIAFTDGRIEIGIGNAAFRILKMPTRLVGSSKYGVKIQYNTQKPYNDITLHNIAKTGQIADLDTRNFDGPILGSGYGFSLNITAMAFYGGSFSLELIVYHGDGSSQAYKSSSTGQLLINETKVVGIQIISATSVFGNGSTLTNTGCVLRVSGANIAIKAVSVEDDFLKAPSNTQLILLGDTRVTGTLENKD